MVISRPVRGFYVAYFKLSMQCKHNSNIDHSKILITKNPAAKIIHSKQKPSCPANTSLHCTDIRHR